MTDYSIVTGVQLASGGIQSASEYPYGAAPSAVLTDGSVFLACHFALWTGFGWNSTGCGMTIWHLSPTLDVLGSIHLDEMGYTAKTAVVISGSKVLLICTDFGSGERSYVIDCSDDTPSIVSQNDNSVTSWLGYNESDTAAATCFIPSLGIVLVAVNQYYGSVDCLQSFDENGVLLQELTVGYGYPYEMHLSPDKTECKFVVWNPDDYTVHVITVGGIGSIMSVTSDVTEIDLYALYDWRGRYWWPIASGSPYGSHGSIVMDDDAYGISDTQEQSGDWSWSYGGSTMDDLGKTNYDTIYGHIGTMMGERSVSVTTATYLYLGPGSWEDDSAHHRFVGVDYSTYPPVREELLLRYEDIGAGDISNDDPMYASPSITSDYASGRICVSSTKQTQAVWQGDYTARLAVWIVQGPSTGPNLSGQLLDDRVRFWGG